MSAATKDPRLRAAHILYCATKGDGHADGGCAVAKALLGHVRNVRSASAGAAGEAAPAGVGPALRGGLERLDLHRLAAGLVRKTPSWPRSWASFSLL